MRCFKKSKHCHSKVFRFFYQQILSAGYMSQTKMLAFYHQKSKVSSIIESFQQRRKLVSRKQKVTLTGGMTNNISSFLALLGSFSHLIYINVRKRSGSSDNECD
jgi:hypothetical protein